MTAYWLCQPVVGSGCGGRKGVGTVVNALMGELRIVDRIPDGDAELVKYLHESGVVPGVEVMVVDVAPYRGVVTLQIGNASAVLGYGVSSEIRLRVGR